MKFQLSIVLIAMLAGAVSCQGLFGGRNPRAMFGGNGGSMFGPGGGLLGGEDGPSRPSIPNMGSQSSAGNFLQKLTEAMMSDVSNMQSLMSDLPSHVSEQVQRFATSMQNVAQILGDASSKSFMQTARDLVSEMISLLPNIPAIITGQVQMPQLMPRTISALREILGSLMKPAARLGLDNFMPRLTNGGLGNMIPNFSNRGSSNGGSTNMFPSFPSLNGIISSLRGMIA